MLEPRDDQDVCLVGKRQVSLLHGTEDEQVRGSPQTSDSNFRDAHDRATALCLHQHPILLLKALLIFYLWRHLDSLIYLTWALERYNAYVPGV